MNRAHLAVAAAVALLVTTFLALASPATAICEGVGDLEHPDKYHACAGTGSIGAKLCPVAEVQGDKIFYQHEGCVGQAASANS